MKNLLFESAEIENIGGFEKKEIEEFKGITHTIISIDTVEASKVYGYEIGKYHLVNFSYDRISSLEKKLVSIIKNILNGLLKINGDILVVGLGNKDIVCDSLGNFVSENIITNIDSKIKLKTIVPSVLGKTGIESYDIIVGVVNQIKPNAVIIVDTLAAGDFSRLFKSIQISNTSITPGSGVDNARKVLSKETLGIPVVIIGVPMLISVENLIMPFDIKNGDSKIMDIYRSLWVSPKDVDYAIKEFGLIIARAINESVYGEFSTSEFYKLTRL